MFTCIYGMHQGKFWCQMFEIMIQNSIIMFCGFDFVDFLHKMPSFQVFNKDFCLESPQQSTRYVTFMF